MDYNEEESPERPHDVTEDFMTSTFGESRKYQILVLLLTSFPGVFISWNTLAAAFLAATPDHWCQIPGLNYSLMDDVIKNIAIPSMLDENNVTTFSKCTFFDHDYSNISQLLEGNLKQAPEVKCSSWYYDTSVYTSTVVSEWDLVCEKRWLTSTIQASYMMGVLVGAVVLSELSDKYGRKSVSCFSSLMYLICGVAATFSNHYITFIVLRFFVAALGSGFFLPNFVLLMETVGRESRAVMGTFYQCFFSVGFMTIPGIAYFIRDWRYLQLTISLPCSVLISYFWILEESPRWLMQQGRKKESLKILLKIATVNGGTLPSEEVLQGLMSTIKEQATLLRTKNIRKRCLIIYFSWFVASLVYYGIAFSGGNINASAYLMVFLSGAVEIPVYILIAYTLNKFGGRLNMSLLFIICGATCLAMLLVPKELIWLNITLATMGKFFNTGAFAVAYIYSAELVPTRVRNIAVGNSSMCARIGSSVAPFIVDLLGDLHYAIPSAVFGVLSLTAGSIDLLLPETGGQKLPETVEEIEAMPR